MQSTYFEKPCYLLFDENLEEILETCKKWGVRIHSNLIEHLLNNHLNKIKEKHDLQDNIAQDLQKQKRKIQNI